MCWCRRLVVGPDNHILVAAVIAQPMVGGVGLGYVYDIEVHHSCAVILIFFITMLKKDLKKMKKGDLEESVTFFPCMLSCHS